MFKLGFYCVFFIPWWFLWGCALSLSAHTYCCSFIEEEVHACRGVCCAGGMGLKSKVTSLCPKLGPLCHQPSQPQALRGAPLAWVQCHTQSTASFNKHSKTSAGADRTASKHELFRNDRKGKTMNTECARHAAASWQGGKCVASTQSLEKMEHSKRWCLCDIKLFRASTCRGERQVFSVDAEQHYFVVFDLFWWVFWGILHIDLMTFLCSISPPLITARFLPHEGFCNLSLYTYLYCCDYESLFIIMCWVSLFYCISCLLLVMLLNISVVGKLWKAVR